MKTTISTLKESPEYRQAVIKLIENAFDYDPNFHFDIDFYPLTSEDNAANCFILLDDKQRVIGHIGTLPKKLANNGRSLPVILIGGIAIDPDHRGKGLLNELLPYVINKYNDSTALFILWGQLVEMYEKYNFHPAIGLLEQSPSYENNETLEETTLQKLSTKDKEQIQKIYNDITSNQFTTILRDAKDWMAIEKIISSKLYLGRNEKNEIEFYFFKGKGQDLQNVIHEFGYRDANSREKLFSILNNEMTWVPEGLIEDFPLAQLCSSALIRIGSTTLFRQFIEEWSHGEITVFNLDENEIEFEFHNNLYDFQLKEFFTMIFGPNPAHELQNFFRPVFISGLDSI